MFLTNLQPLIVVCVYDRIANLQAWVECWKACKQAKLDYGAKFLVIHNHDWKRPHPQAAKICREGPVDFYIHRKNLGMDMGAFQDLVKGRLRLSSQVSMKQPGQLIDIGNWDTVLWSSDDSLPMQKSFLHHFLQMAHSPDIGACGPEISNETSYHLRTNCFCLKREIAEQLKFPLETMRSRDDAYDFEHRGWARGGYHMTKQIQRMGLKVAQLHPDIAHVMWDTGHRAHLNRWEQHFKVFPSSRHILSKIK